MCSISINSTTTMISFNTNFCYFSYFHLPIKKKGVCLSKNFREVSTHPIISINLEIKLRMINYQLIIIDQSLIETERLFPRFILLIGNE